MDLAIVRRNDFQKVYNNIREEYILIVDSGDEVNEATLHLLKGADIDADIVVFDYVNRYQDKFEERKKANTYYVPSSQIVKSMLAGYYSATLRNKIFKKSLFNDVKFIKVLDEYFDLALCVEIFQQERNVCYVPEIISTRNVSNERITKGNACNMLYFMTTLNQIKAYDYFYKKILPILNEENRLFFYNVTAKIKLHWINGGLIKHTEFNKYAPIPLSELFKLQWSRKSLFYLMLSYLRKG